MALPSAALPRMSYRTVIWSAPVGAEVTVASLGAGELSFDCAASNFQVPAQGSDGEAALSFCAKAKAPTRIKAKTVSLLMMVSFHTRGFSTVKDEVRRGRTGRGRSARPSGLYFSDPSATKGVTLGALR